MRAVVAGVLFLAIAAGSLSGAVYVSPQGDDAAVGTREAPLATLMAARDRVRTLAEDRTVVLMDGVYRLTEPLELSATDGGTADRPVVWRAECRGKAVVSGTAALRWAAIHPDDPDVACLPSVARDQIQVATIPGEGALPGFHGGGEYNKNRAKEDAYFLISGSRRLPVARWPDEGWTRTGEVLTNGLFRFADRNRLTAWARERDLWAKGLWNVEWDDRRLEVLNVDPAAGTIEVNAHGNPYGFKSDRNFHVFNALSELDRPGEWVLDRRGHRVIAWREENASPEIVAAKNLVRMRDVGYVAFDGIRFVAARDAAVDIAGSRHVRLRGCEITLTGGWGVLVSGGEDVKVRDCDLFHLGEGGVRLEGGERETLTPARHSVENCHVAYYGEVSPNYKPGVALFGVGNSVIHCLIHHSDHQGISFRGNDHRIAFNVVHDTCRFNDDAGAIYACTRDWTQLGTVIEHNLVHWTGKNPRPTMTHAIYLDDYTSGVIVRGNVLNRATLGVYVGGGHDVTVEGNVMVGMTAPVQINSRGIRSFAKHIASKGDRSFLYKALSSRKDFYSAGVWHEHYPYMLSPLGPEDPVFAHNALHNVVTGNVFAASGEIRCDADIAEPKWNMLEPNKVVKGDPGFADYRGLDFSLSGIRFAEMGLYESPYRLSPVVKFGADATHPTHGPAPAYAPAKVRIDLVSKAGSTDAPFAGDLVGCMMPAWGKGVRLLAEFGEASGEWREYAFAFTPKMDTEVEFTLMGNYGDKTVYDAFKVEGCPFADSGCEDAKGAWREQDHREHPPIGDVERPYGIVNGVESGFSTFEGTSAAMANHERRLVQKISLRAGMRVSVKFRARCR